MIIRNLINSNGENANNKYLGGLTFFTRNGATVSYEGEDRDGVVKHVETKYAQE